MGSRALRGASVLAVLLFAGCGSSAKSSSEAQQVTAAFHTYANALQAHNGAAACAAMTPALAKQFQHAVARSAAGRGLAGESCAQMLDSILSGASGADATLLAFKRGTIEHLRLTGNAASFDLHVVLAGKPGTVPAEEQKLNGGWRFSCCIAPGA